MRAYLDCIPIASRKPTPLEFPLNACSPSFVVLSVFINGISPSVEGAPSLWQFGPRESNSDLDPNLLCLHTPRLAFPLRLSLNYGRPPTVANYVLESWTPASRGAPQRDRVNPCC